MMKQIILISLGFFPMLLFGYYLGHLIMTTFYYVAGPYFLFGLAVFAFWFVFGMLSIKLVRSKKEAVLLLNAPAFLVLLLYLFQEIVLGHMWVNHVGFATQMFYLPLGHLGFRLSNIIPRFILPTISFGIANIISFICLLGMSYLGYSAAERFSRKTIKS